MAIAAEFQHWLEEQSRALSLPEVAHWQPLSGDAGQRRYFRAEPEIKLLAVYAPPETENSKRFVELAQQFRAHGVPVPKVIAHDFQRGYLLLEDLGPSTLWTELNAENRDGLYAQAFSLLMHFQHEHFEGMLLPYSSEILREEFQRFATWFVKGLLGLTLCESELLMLDALEGKLVESALAQKQVAVHRDFHSRNLVLGSEGNLGLIDFQDALFGPITYDLVSLVKDCYVEWPEIQINLWARTYFSLLQNSGLIDVSFNRFERDMHWMGLQRHLKVLGVFARLHIRDQKSHYLKDIPLVMHHIERVIFTDPEFSEFALWWKCALLPAYAHARETELPK